MQAREHSVHDVSKKRYEDYEWDGSWLLYAYYNFIQLLVCICFFI